MNDPAANHIRQSNQRPKAPMVDTTFPRAGGVYEVGAGTSAVVDQQGGEGVVGGVAPGCPPWCGYNANGIIAYCSVACREWATWGREL